MRGRHAGRVRGEYGGCTQAWLACRWGALTADPQAFAKVDYPVVFWAGW